MAGTEASRPIRVLHTLSCVHSGGVEQLRVLLARGLPAGRYEHALITQESAGGIPGVLSDAGWSIHDIGIARHILDPAWYARAASIAREFAPDLIHGAVFEGNALANVLGLRFPRTPVISEETSNPLNRSWRGNLLIRGFYLRSQAVIAVSPAVVDYLIGVAKVPARKVIHIDNAVEQAATPNPREIDRLRQKLGLAAEDVVIGSVDRIQDDPKRFSDLILAFGEVSRNIPRARLLLVGDGPDRAMLERLAEQRGLGDAVVFAGYQADPRPFYWLMDVFALASAREAFGLVLVEAMLAGVPVVATAVGGMPHVLGHGAAGVLVPPLDPPAMAREITRLLMDAPERRRLAHAGQERARSEFSPERYCADIDRLYRRLARLVSVG